MKKNILGIAVVFLLIVFPIGSWYYLKSGFEYRVDALTELKTKGKLNPELVDSFDLHGSTLVIHNADMTRDADKTKINSIKEQYAESMTFKWWDVSEANMESILSECYWNSDSLGINKKSIFEHAFTLVDTDMNVRNYYESPHDTSYNQLVKHLAIILPTKKDPDIILKRQSEK